MRPSDLMLDLGRPVAFYPGMAKYVGGVNACLFLCQLLYWSDKSENEIGIYKTAEEWTVETGLSYKEQATARKKLRELGLISEVEKRLEHKIYYLIDTDRLNDIIETADSRKGSSRKSHLAFRGDHNGLSVHTENTTQTTTETLPALQAGEMERQECCRAIWSAYSGAYFQRYGAEPVRNAKINGQINQLHKRLGGEAPLVADYFVGINDSFLIRSVHEFGLLLSKAEAYRTQWATGRQMNGVTARQIENTQANISAADEAIRMMREGGIQNAFIV